MALGRSSLLEFRTPRCAGKWNHVADIAHTGDELNGSFQAQAKASVRHGAKAAEIEVPPVVFGLESLLVHSLGEYIEPLFALAAADDLANLGHEHIHRADSFAVIVDPHVERLYCPRIVIQDHRQLK